MSVMVEINLTQQQLDKAVEEKIHELELALAKEQTRVDKAVRDQTKKIERNLCRQQKKNDELKAQVYDLKRQLNKRDVTVERAQRILNAVLEAGDLCTQEDADATAAESAENGYY